MNKTFKIFLIIIIILVVASVILSIINNKEKTAEKIFCYKKTVVVWAPFESKYIKTKEIGNELKKYCLTLKYEKKTIEEIKKEALQKIASGEGSAVLYTDYDFLAENTSVFSGKSQETWLDSKDYPDIFKDEIIKKVFVYPVTYDTLVLFWNKDILNSIGYTEPPLTFEGVYEIIPKLKQVDSIGQIILSPIALGSSDNINPYFEIFLTMLKMKNSNLKKNSSEVSKAIISTLQDYTQFANSGSENFSWHSNLPKQRDAFLGEKVAMIIDFYNFKNEIKKRNPRFNFEVAPFLKFENYPKKVNYLNPHFFATTKENSEIGKIFLKVFDKNYEKFIKNTGISPIKISLGKNLEGEEKILFNEMIIGDNFSDVNKEYLKPYIKEDIDNWLLNQKDVKQLISSKQAFRFYKK